MSEERNLDNLLIQQIGRIMEAINDDDNVVILNETSLLFEILPDHIIKEHEGLKKEIITISEDGQKIRSLRLTKRIKEETETAIEYYGKDIGNDERLIYKRTLEKEMLTLQNKIRRFLAVIVKKYMGGTIDIR